MHPWEWIFTRQGRRRLSWEIQGRIRARITFAYDGDLRISGPAGNRSARKAFIQGYNDPKTFEWLDSFLRPGMTVFDVGANVGLYALFAAKRVRTSATSGESSGQGGRVFAFEADPDTAQDLAANADANHMSNLTVVRCAVGDRSGALAIERNARNIGASHVFADQGPKSAGFPTVPVVRLDEFAHEQAISFVDFVKFDLEGYEAKALDGMRGLLVGGKVGVVLTEVSERQLARYGNTTQDIRRCFEPLGFIAHQFGEGGLQPYDWTRSLGDALWLRV